jgi:hypothetical protein
MKYQTKRTKVFYIKPLRNTEETLVSTRRKVARVGNSELFLGNKGLVPTYIG